MYEMYTYIYNIICIPFYPMISSSAIFSQDFHPGTAGISAARCVRSAAPGWTAWRRRPTARRGTGCRTPAEHFRMAGGFQSQNGGNQLLFLWPNMFKQNGMPMGEFLWPNMAKERKGLENGQISIGFTMYNGSLVESHHRKRFKQPVEHMGNMQSLLGMSWHFQWGDEFIIGRSSCNYHQRTFVRMGMEFEQCLNYFLKSLCAKMIE